MHITQTRKKNKIIAAIIIVFLLIVSGTLVWHLNNPNKRQTEEIDRTSSVQQEQADKNTTSSESTLPSKTSTNDDTATHSGTATPTSPPEQPNLLRADGGNTVKVVATFQQASNGYCQLLMTKSGSPSFTQETNVTIGTNYYSCSFSILASSLTSGQWSLKVVHHIGESKTSSDTREVAVD